MQGQYCPLSFFPPNLIFHQRSPLLHLAFIPSFCSSPGPSYCHRVLPLWHQCIFFFFFFCSLLHYCLQYTYVMLIHILTCCIFLLSFKEYLIKTLLTIIVFYVCISLSLLSPSLSFTSVTPLSVFLSSLSISSTFFLL